MSLEKLMRSRTLILRKTNASLIFPSKYGQYLWRKKTVLAENFWNFKKFGTASARGRCWPAQPRPHRIFHGGTGQGTGTPISPWLTSLVQPLCIGTVRAGDWNASCNFVLGKQSCCAGCLCPSGAAAEMGHWRRMLFWPDEDCRNSARNGMVASVVLFSQLALCSWHLVGAGQGRENKTKKNSHQQQQNFWANEIWALPCQKITYEHKRGAGKVKKLRQCLKHKAMMQKKHWRIHTGGSPGSPKSSKFLNSSTIIK